jgi:2-keto-4-pentenoate hydratase/2-oxohepta-3-ene-1,7-dioic acid hydratase in catechol pathway
VRLITFLRDGTTRIGVQTSGGVVDFHVAGPTLPSTMLDLLHAGTAAWRTAAAVVARALDDGVGLIPDAEIRVLAPLPRPGKIFGIALNYRDHAGETGKPIPEVPSVFSKAVTAVVGPGAAIEIPAVSAEIDYEGELAVIIGTRAKRVRRDQALSVVAGYTIMNDVTARDYQRRSGHCIGKSFDTFAPMGPALVTPDELSDVHHLGLRTLLNDEAVQEANTRHMIFDVPALIEFISAAVTLEPGDVITTGTPAGVGVRRNPPRFLQPGDVVRVEIDGIGVLENIVSRACES